MAKRKLPRNWDFVALLLVILVLSVIYAWLSHNLLIWLIFAAIILIASPYFYLGWHSDGDGKPGQPKTAAEKTTDNWYPVAGVLVVGLWLVMTWLGSYHNWSVWLPLAGIVIILGASFYHGLKSRKDDKRDEPQTMDK